MKFAELPHGNSALAIFPSVSGFGWIVFDGPLSPVDWGVSTVARRVKGNGPKNARCVSKVESLLKQFSPATIVLEAFEGAGTKRHERIKRLCHAIISTATMRGIVIRILSRQQIQKCFASKSPTTRHEVAMVVASYIREIRHLLPKKRRLWESELPEMALFAAAALLIVHYANPREPL